MLLRDELIGDVCPECDELEKAAGSWAAAVMNERNEEKRATVAVETEEIRLPTTGEVRVVESWHLPAENQQRSDKDHMVDTIIAQQVVAGGYDTEGTRAQAERWCAMLAGCVCEGMRATTWRSAYRDTWGDTEGGCAAADRGYLAEPLGRP